jgi:hypothetical protein
MKIVLAIAFIALLAQITLAADVFRVRTIVHHTKIPEKDVFADGGAHWRIYDLSGIYSTWIPDTGGYASCGVEKLARAPEGGIFPALIDRGTTVVDYFTTDASLDKETVEKVFADCLTEYVKRRLVNNPGEWELKVEKVDTDITASSSSCYQTLSKDCAVSPFGRECSGNEQCGGGMIKCQNGVCNSAAQIALMVVFGIISVAILF